MERVLLTGRNGQVGSELQTALSPFGDVHAVGRSELDLTREDSIRTCVRELRPSIIVNAAGYTRVDDVESDRDLAMRVNAIAPGVLAEEADRIGAILIHYSTDYVYDGLLGRPYVENDAPHPVNVYGATKLAGDEKIASVGGDFLILRTSWVYSDRRVNFVQAVLRLARERSEIQVVADQFGSPSSARMLANATADLLRRRELIRSNCGIYHLSAANSTSRCEFAKAIVDHAALASPSGTRLATVTPIQTSQYPTPARRPLRLTTSKEKMKAVFGIEMPRWEVQLEMFMNEHLPAMADASGGL